jgi:hypothetical protein
MPLNGLLKYIVPDILGTRRWERGYPDAMNLRNRCAITTAKTDMQFMVVTKNFMDSNTTKVYSSPEVASI